MVLYSQEYLCDSTQYLHVDRSKVSYHAKARNELCQAMLGDWIFMTDGDHDLPPDILARLLQLLYKYGVEVISGTYHVKIPPHPPLIYAKHSDESLREKGYELVACVDNPGELVKIDAVGAGCLLIRRRLLHKLITELREQPFAIIPPLSEDLSFCRRLEKLNVPLYWAPNIISPHLDVMRVVPDEEELRKLASEARETEGLLKGELPQMQK
jgi:GT2 family glycosyltransferase